ncbi:MAG: PEP-CTERM sorting domain-containing protein [Chthoniobacter sp.]|nr:PEP-CTERM sorting domain-containing protein [Chthoniobacter sp.]
MKSSHILLAATVTALCHCATVAAPIIWNSGTGHNNHGYEAFLASGGIDWTTAESNAISLGGHLASITSAAENAFVFSLVSSNSSFWIIESASPGASGIGPWLGGVQPTGSPEPAGGWQWSDGDTFAYTNWAPFEPSNGQGINPRPDENRISFFGKNTLIGSTWNDYPISPVSPQVKPVAYIVETVPEPSTALLGALGISTLLLRRFRNQPSA